MFCQHCGAQIADEAVFCGKCGVAVPKAKAQVNATASDSALRMLIPIDRSGWAIAAGYLAFFSIFPLIGIISLIIGIVAINDIKKHPGLHGMGRAWFGIFAGTISTLFYLIALIASAS